MIKHYNITFPPHSGVEVAFTSPAYVNVTESNVSEIICLELTQLPPGGLECDLELSLVPLQRTAGN